MEPLESRCLLAANVVISEFLAANSENLADQDGEFSDWIELFNAGDASENLDGWFLTDDAGDLARWRLPAVTLAPGEYRVVFASGKHRVDPLAELHTNFRLEQDGEYLGLVRPDGVTVESDFGFSFPPQRTDVSYGSALSTATTQLVAGDAASTVLIPSISNGGSIIGSGWTGLPGNEPFDDAAWIHGPLPAGIADGSTSGTESQSFNDAPSSVAAGWQGRRNVDGALRTNFGFSSTNNAGANSGEIGGTIPGRTTQIASFADTNLGGNLTQHHALTATGRIAATAIAAFDGGFELGWFDVAVSEGTTSFLGVRIVDGTSSSLRWGPRRDVNGLSEGIQQGDQLDVGQDYFFTLTYEPEGDGAGVGRLSIEMRGAADNISLGVRSLSFPSTGAAVSLNAFGIKTLDFNANTGGSVNLFIDDLSYTTLLAATLGTNLQVPMDGINSTAMMRTEFNVANPTAYDRLRLRMRYNDGFVAYLNGVEVAARNAPPAVAWDSTATAQRTSDESAVVEAINLSPALSALRIGRNVLAIHGLNFTSVDGSFLVAPELIADTLTLGQSQYYLTPTPREDNGTGVLDFVADTQFSVDRGLFAAPIGVAITTTTPGATIVYTFDGSVPTLTHGTVVPPPDALTSPTANVMVSATTTLRAAAFKDQFQPTNIDTQTYLFPADIVHQSTALALSRDYPAGWQPGFAADYAMDPNVVGDPQFSELLDTSLRSIPTLSIVSDRDGLFGATNGIYNHSENIGDAWERASSIEWIDAAGGSEFQVDAGVRIHGGSSRNPASTLKHSLRISFDDQYGPADLTFPLFGDGAVSEFDKLVLRGPYTDSWTPRTSDPEYHPANAQFFRDQWMRDTQRAMGHLSAQGRFAHVYLNGLYWGIYNVTERTDAQFAAENLGGSDEEYDAIKDSEALDGDRQAWDAMLAIANAPAGLAGAAEYQAIQEYVDPVNLIDYMLLHIYSGGLDWPDHNWAAVRRRQPGETFRFLVWDQDIGLDDPSALTNHAQVDASDSPARLYNRLLANADFRRLLGDRVQKHFFNDGVLTVAAAQQRWLALAAQIDSAVIAESARWGDVREGETGTTFTRNDWIVERDHVVNSLIPQRHALALSQLRAAGLFPNVVAPSFTPHGGVVTAGSSINIDAPTGTVYYTRDGSDPLLPDGAVNPAAQVVGIQTTTLVPQNALARFLVPTTSNGGDALGVTWNGADDDEPFDDSSWLPATTAVGFPASSGTETMTFSDQATAAAAGWTEHRAHDVGLGTDYGFRATATAGGLAGEAGGKIPSRTASVSYFADTAIGTFSQNDPLNASGKFTVATVDANYDGGFHVGFFDANVTEGSPNVIGFRTLEQTTAVLRWQARAVINGQVFEAPPLVNLAVGTDYTFSLAYVPSAATGLLTVQLVRQSDGGTLGTSTLNVPTAGAAVALGAFGLMSLDLGVNATQSVATFLDDLTYSSGTAFPVTTDVESAMRNINATAFLRTTFSLAQLADWDALRLRMQFDDAFVAYLNGVEIARSANAPVTPAWNSAAVAPRPTAQVLQFVEFDVSSRLPLLRAGVNVLAIHGLNVSDGDGEFLLLPELVAINDLGSNVTLQQTTTLKSRSVDGGTWSALTESLFIVQTPVRVTEINYHPGNRTPAEIAAGFTNDDDFEFLEVTNISATDGVNLSGLRFVEGIQFEFGNLTLGPGEGAVVVRDQAAFEYRYGIGHRVAGQYGGTPDDVRLSNSGEVVTLIDAAGGTIQSFRYDDDWLAATDGGGPTLVIVAPNGPVTNWEVPTGWRESFQAGGSPGEKDLLLGDLDEDHRVGLLDLAILQANLGIASGAARADGDLNQDGTVNRGDATILARNWGRFYISQAPAHTASPAASVLARVRSAPRARVAAPVERSRPLAATDWTHKDVLRVVPTRRQSHEPRESLSPAAVDQVHQRTPTNDVADGQRR